MPPPITPKVKIRQRVGILLAQSRDTPDHYSYWPR